MPYLCSNCSKDKPVPPAKKPPHRRCPVEDCECRCHPNWKIRRAVRRHRENAQRDQPWL